MGLSSNTYLSLVNVVLLTSLGLSGLGLLTTVSIESFLPPEYDWEFVPAKVPRVCLGVFGNKYVLFKVC